MAGAAAGTLPPPRYNKYRLYFMYKVKLVRRGHPAAVSKILKLHYCCFYDFYISKFVVGWLVCCWFVVVCCKLKLDSGRNLYKLFHWIKKKVCLEQSFQHGSHRSFISISHHPLSREYIVSHFSSNYYYYPWIIEDIVIQIFECSFPFF
jgi:hypothetical protein